MLLSWWCHRTISSSVAPFFSCPHSSNQSLFQWVSFSHLVMKYWSFSFSISTSNEYSGLISLKIEWFDLLAVQGTLKSLLQHQSLKASVLQCSACYMVQLSHLYMTTGKNIALTIWTFVGEATSLLFDTLSRFVIAFLLLGANVFSFHGCNHCAVILEPKNIVCYCFHCSSIYLPSSGGIRCHDHNFLNVEF